MDDLVAGHLQATRQVPWDALSAEADATALRSLDRPGWRALHHRLIERIDTPRSQDRAAAMRAAIEALTSPLDDPWERLQARQALVLQAAAPFRPGPAFARGGAVAYAWHPDLEAAFRRKLAADVAERQHPLVAATRLALDLAYVHPFEDGNARAMRLAWHDRLAGAGIGLRDLEPLVRLPLVVPDPGLYREVFTLALGLAATCRYD